MKTETIPTFSTSYLSFSVLNQSGIGGNINFMAGGGGVGKYGMRMLWRQSGRALCCWKKIGHDFVRVGMRKTSSGKQELKS